MTRVVKVVGNEDRCILDLFEAPMAPFIVMEKGQSLQERTRNNRVDVFTAAQVRKH